MDVELVRQCADDSLKPEIVERFVEAMGVESALAVTVTTGGKTILIPAPKTPTEAVHIIRGHLGKAIVRVGLTQYPAGVGASEASQIDERLVDPCANIRLGTTLFAKIYRIVTNWYGGFMPEAFDDSIEAYRSGYFEGEYVFAKGDPGTVEPRQAVRPMAEDGEHEPSPVPEPVFDEDPNDAGTRIDLGRIRLSEDGDFSDAAAKN